MDATMNVMIDTELLIKAVKRHPALYKKSDPSYFHKSSHKPKIWHEVCREVLPNWEQLKPQERVGFVFQIQKRWKNLRTCFGREVHSQKQEAQQRKQNLQVKPRKIYGYFKKLSFLIEDEDGDEETKADESDDDYDPLVNLKTESYDMENEVTLEMAPDAYAQAFEPITSKEKLYANLNNPSSDDRTDERQVIEYLKNVKKDIKKDEEDEDKQFLMSLIPTFRKLSDKQKFEARIEILKTLKEISFRSDAEPSC